MTESLRLCRRQVGGDKQPHHLATAQAQYQRAALLFGLAEQANSQIHHAYAGLLRTQTDAALATVRAALDPAEFVEAFAAGQQLSLDEAFATVLHPTAIAARGSETMR